MSSFQPAWGIRSENSSSGDDWHPLRIGYAFNCISSSLFITLESKLSSSTFYSSTYEFDSSTGLIPLWTTVVNFRGFGLNLKFSFYSYWAIEIIDTDGSLFSYSINSTNFDSFPFFNSS